MKQRKKYAAIILCMALGGIAVYAGGLQKVVGSPMIGLIIAMIFANALPGLSQTLKEGTSFVGKKFLVFGIVMAGATLNLTQVLGYGAKALPLIGVNIVIAFAVAYFVGRRLQMTDNTCTLVGGGTCICGGTAIATLASIIKAKESEIAYAMTAIFLFDILAALVYPYLAGAIGLTPNQFGFLAGTAINDTCSVAAAEATYNVLNACDLQNAITVKLTRTTMLIVLAVIFTLLSVRHEIATGKAADASQPLSRVMQTVKKVFPWFILIFVAMALLNTFGLFKAVHAGLPSFFKLGYKFLITVALVGVGFKIQIRELLTKGIKPILLGGFTWLAIACSSLTFIYLFAAYIG